MLSFYCPRQGTSTVVRYILVASWMQRPFSMMGLDSANWPTSLSNLEAVGAGLTPVCRYPWSSCSLALVVLKCFPFLPRKRAFPLSNPNICFGYLWLPPATLDNMAAKSSHCSPFVFPHSFKLLKPSRSRCSKGGLIPH